MEFAGGEKSSATLQPTVGSIAIIDADWTLSRKRAKNPLTGGQRVSNPDTGFDGVHATYNFVATSVAAGSAVDRLKKWAVADNAPSTKLRYGRISLKDKLTPALDVNASATVGLKLAGLKLKVNHHDKNFTGSITLILDGSPSALGGA